jgi:hypothetical protein
LNRASIFYLIARSARGAQRRNAMNGARKSIATIESRFDLLFDCALRARGSAQERHERREKVYRDD